MRSSPDDGVAGLPSLLGVPTIEEEVMRGTLVCGLTDGEDAVGTVGLAAELTERLGMRLVLAHVAEGFAPNVDGGDLEESVTMKGNRIGAERLLDQLAAEHGVAETAERRIAVGQPASLLGQIAAEEAADLIVVGSRERGWPRRRLESRLAAELETETPVPVLIAPPRTRVDR
jgi:nucleotide-binding universal stress UspA family protein